MRTTILALLLGVPLAALPQDKAFASLRAGLSRIQEELFIVGALLATPEARLDKLRAPFNGGLPAEACERLENEIDAMTAALAPMTKFIMPGGNLPGAWLHLARAACRRARGQARVSPVAGWQCERGAAQADRN